MLHKRSHKSGEQLTTNVEEPASPEQLSLLTGSIIGVTQAAHWGREFKGWNASYDTDGMTILRDKRDLSRSVSFSYDEKGNWHIAFGMRMMNMEDSPYDFSETWKTIRHPVTEEPGAVDYIVCHHTGKNSLGPRPDILQSHHEALPPLTGRQCDLISQQLDEIVAGVTVPAR